MCGFPHLLHRSNSSTEMVEFMEKVIGARRASWRIISSIDQKEESRGNEGHVSTICEYRSKIESELSSICDGILKLLDSKLIGSASSGDSKCKKCNASMPPALGTKRLASEDPVQDWDNKRLNAGQQAYPPTGQIASSSYLTPFPMASSASNQTAGLFQLYPDGMAPAVQHSQLNLQLPQIMALPTLHGKGVL